MDERPDPDHLLSRLKAEASAAKRGKLKLFFGANAGVGKTYAMLEAARARKKEGVDVVVGIVETHGRSETAALLDGLEVLPRKEIDYKGVKVREFDIDAALARKTALILVDELAHTNAPSSRHSKRWQDVEELLEAGIGVYTTLNVQHWESLNDIVAQITGVVVRETVPDTFLERTHELELVDLSPEDLLQRLKEGKVYRGESAERAADNFFQPGNLIALRELAMRHAAERVDVQVQAFKEDHAISGVWPVQDRLLVGVTASPMSPRLVRATARLAARLRSEWIAVHVEIPGSSAPAGADRKRLLQTFKLAEQLGAETVTLTGTNVTPELLQYARSRNVTKIVIGKPAQPLWKEWFYGSIVNQMARRVGDIDLYIISGVGSALAARREVQTEGEFPWAGVAWATGIVALCTLVNWPLHFILDRVNLVMLYLLGVMGVAYRFGRRPAFVASALSVVAFDYFFVPPILNFGVSDTQYVITFGVMFGIGLLISTLVTRLSGQAERLRRREYRVRMLYRLSRTLSETPDPKALLPLAWKQLTEFYALPLLLLVPEGKKGLHVAAGNAAEFGLTPEAMGAAEWVLERGESAGAGTDTLASMNALYIPLRGLQRPVGVLAVKPPDPTFFQDPDQFRMLETLASEIGGALESTQMTESAGRAQAEIETQRLRNLLLTTFSYDLRDPLNRLSRRIGEVLDPATKLSESSRQALMREIRDEADRLKNLAADLPRLLDIENK
jgi:two-component system, OmpR family, sensor histidine kinase KdpD